MTSVGTPAGTSRSDRIVHVCCLVGACSLAVVLGEAPHLAPWLGLVGIVGLVAPAGAESDVEHLIDGVERVADGAYDDASFDLGRDDDLGRLADALETMTGRVAERERALAEDAAYTDEVLDAIDDVFYVLDREGGHRRWNRTLADASGYDHDEVAEMGPLDYFEGDDEATIASGIEEAFETGSARVEADLHTKDGEAVPYEWIASRLTAPDGTPVVAGIGRDVSERVEAERRVSERERRLDRYRTYTDEILDSMDDLFYVVERDLTMQRWNRSFREATGLTDEEIAEMDPLEFVVSEDRDAVTETVREVFETGSGRTEARVRWTDGTVVPYEFIGSRLEDPEGTPVLVGVGRDVSERRERQRKLEALVENTTTPIYIKDREGRYTFANQATATYFDEVPADVVGTHDEDLFDPESAADVRETDERVLATGETVTEETSRVIDGEEYVFLDNKYPYCDETGEIIGVMGISRDITGRKRRERRIQETNAQLEAIIEASPDAIVAIDREGTVKRWNPAAERIFGWSAGEVVGEPLPFVPGDRTDEFESLRNRLLDGESVTGVETRRRTREGSLVDVSLSVAPLRDAEGDVDGAMAVLEDSTERKAQERELERTRDLLQQAQHLASVGAWELDLPAEEAADLTWNDQVYRIHEVSPAEEIGLERALEFYYPDDRDRVRTAVERAIEAGEPFDVEARVLTGQGNVRWVRTIGEPVVEDGEVVGVHGSIQDVTERSEREEALAARSAAIEESIDGIAILDADQRYTFVNQAHAEVYGYDDPEAFIGNSWRMCYDDEEAERLATEVLPIVLGEGAWRGAATGRRADGTTFPQELSLTTIEDGRTICIVRDTTERTERQRELERSTTLLEQAQRVARVGGWELDVGAEPPEFEGTDQFYEIHGVSPKSEFDAEMALSFYHPADRDRIARAIEGAIEEGTSYDVEARLSTAADQTRWVRAIGEPVVEDGDVVALRGSMQDITDRKEQELTLQSLHEVARGLLEAESTPDVADLVVDAGVEVLDLPCVAAFLLDDDTGQLEPTAVSEEFSSLCEVPEDGHAADGESVLWETYVSGTARTLHGAAIEECQFTTRAVNAGLLVPIGDYGVLVGATPRDGVPDDDRRVAETLVATMEAALHRIDSEADLRAREAELAERNRRLRRQIQITEIIRRVDESLVGATTREAVESAVCERLVESEDVAFAWIGALDPEGDRLEPRAWAGTDHEYLDAIRLETAAEATDPAVDTAVSGESAVVESVVDSVKQEDWRKHALVRDFSSIVAVPVRFDEVSYGVLAVYASEPGAFDDLERTVFEELGEGIANSINALEARHALYTDAFVELRLRLDGGEDFLGRIAQATGARVEYVGLATHAEDESRLFFETEGGTADAIRSALEERHAVRNYRLISEADEPDLFEATVAGEVLAAKLVSRGGVPRSMAAEGDRLEVVVDVPTTTDVREFVEMLEERHPSVELTARRDVRRDVQTRQELVADLFDELTDRQVEVLRTAFFAGFFEWPRESTGEEIADLLDVSQPTVNRHLRHGMARLLQQLFEVEPTTLAEA